MLVIGPAKNKLDWDVAHYCMKFMYSVVQFRYFFNYKIFFHL